MNPPEASTELTGKARAAAAFARQPLIQDAAKRLAKVAAFTVPSPDRFPLPREEALRFWLPTMKGRAADRAKLFRRFLRAAGEEGAGSAAFGPEQFRTVGIALRAWHAAEISQARRNAAAKRHAPRNVRKRKKPS